MEFAALDAPVEKVQPFPAPFFLWEYCPSPHFAVCFVNVRVKCYTSSQLPSTCSHGCAAVVQLARGRVKYATMRVCDDARETDVPLVYQTPYQGSFARALSTSIGGQKLLQFVLVAK